jgi:hypothetical protein
MLRTSCFTMLACVCITTAAIAQGTLTGWGPRVGISTSPDQLVLGGQLVTDELAPHVIAVPNLELGFGDDVTVIAINGDFHYRLAINGSDWVPYLGLGIGINFVQVDLPAPFEDESDTDIAANFILGASVPTRSGSRFFTELKAMIGAEETPDLKIMVGWNFKLGR